MLSSDMTGEATCLNNVWYIDSRASNHITNHAKWFREMQNLERLDYVETGDDIAHSITHIRKVPLSM